jgi:hypothetical protein
MEFPDSVFFATGKKAELVIDSERRRLKTEADKKQVEGERDAALRSVVQLRAALKQMQMIAAIALFILMLVISIIAVWFWLNANKQSTGPVSQPSATPHSPECNPLETARLPPPVLSQRCTRGCCAPDYWEHRAWRFHSGRGYGHFECWRDRGIQGFCFD